MKNKISSIGILGGILMIYYIAPVVSLLFWNANNAIIPSVMNEDVISAMITSVGTSIVSVSISCILGIPLAYFLSRTIFRWKNIVLFVVFLPLVLPPIVSGMVLLTLFGPGSILGSLAMSSGIELTQSLVGIILAQVFVISPFIVIATKVGFDSVDEKLEYTSRSLGRTKIETFWKVTLPLSMRGIIAGIMLAFARSMGEFGATIMMAYYPRTMPTQIWVSFITGGVEKAFPVAIVLLGSSIVVILLISILGQEVRGSYAPY
jgi:molybdate/tungstate transport system permease protein